MESSGRLRPARDRGGNGPVPLARTAAEQRTGADIDTIRRAVGEFVMRDVTLWAFTVPFFEARTAELEEFETAMRYMDQPVHAYLAQLAVIQGHDTVSRLGEITTPALVLAGE